jgi:hypothetical protein
MVQKLNQKQIHPCVTDSPNSYVTLEPRSPWLLGRCSRQLRKTCADASMMYTRTVRVFILELCFTWESFVALPKAFSNAYPKKKVADKTTIHRLEQNFEWMLVFEKVVAVKLFFKFFLTNWN